MTIQTSKPHFSVVIPLYNKLSHIIRTVDSVLRQSYKDFEIIVVDDGSTDGGPTRLQRLRSEHVRLVRQVNGGVSNARNRGIKEAKGEIVAFLDADDTWEPHFLEVMAKLQRDFPDAKAFGSAYQFVASEGEYLDPKIRFAKPVRNARLLTDYFEVGARGDLPFMMSSFCVMRAVCVEVGGFPEGEPMGEDQEFFARVALGHAIAYSPEVLSFYHLDSTNRACVQKVPLQECPFSQRLKEKALSLEEGSTLREQLLDYTSAHLLHLVSQNVRAGNLQVAGEMLGDERCTRQALRYGWWRLRLLLSGMFMVSSPRLYS